jgi:hypothetical protein
LPAFVSVLLAGMDDTKDVTMTEEPLWLGMCPVATTDAFNLVTSSGILWDRLRMLHPDLVPDSTADAWVVIVQMANRSDDAAIRALGHAVFNCGMALFIDGTDAYKNLVTAAWLADNVRLLNAIIHAFPADAVTTAISHSPTMYPFGREKAPRCTQLLVDNELLKSAAPQQLEHSRPSSDYSSGPSVRIRRG